MDRKQIVEKKQQYVYPAVYNYFTDPLPMACGFMQHIWDVDGRQYLDFFGGIVTVGVGHANPRITSAQKQQLDTMSHCSTVYPTEQMSALAEKIAQITPGKLEKSFFTSSGSEANETAIDSARMHTGRMEIIALRHSYSGRSALTRSLTGIAAWRKATYQVGVVHAMNPYCYRCPLGKTYPSCEVACAQDIEATIQASTSGAIAGMIAEPIQGVGGFITPPKEYFKLAFSIVKKYGGDFIADEVQTGWGRTGKGWFGIEHWEVEPDILTAAKSLGNGFPIGLTVATPEIANAYQGPTIATFGGNPVACVTARAVIDLIEEDDLIRNCDAVGGYLRDGLLELQRKYRVIGDVRGMGLMQALELVTDPKTKEPAPDLTNQMLEAAREAGLLIGKGGMYNNVLRMSPPMNIAKSDVDEALRMLDTAFASVTAKTLATV
ncbi:MAG TPA: aspartate aminotransferase family protein [Acidobacteriaceae bacterium]|nr:aspartate aminotransferase family protein [Acidobacteriaceae bacterium]